MNRLFTFRLVPHQLASPADRVRSKFFTQIDFGGRRAFRLGGHDFFAETFVLVTMSVTKVLLLGDMHDGKSFDL